MDARLKVLSNDCFVGVVLNMLNIGDIDLLKSALELLFSLSRSTRGLKPELLTEAVSTTSCQLLEHCDGKVKELVLKILCNTVLNYDSLQIDVTIIVSKTCKLVALSTTRELALWLLKNLTFIDKAELKQAILEAIPLEEFVSMASNGTAGEQLQSLGLLRNLLYPYAVVNLSCGSERVKTLLLDSSLLPVVMDLLERQEEEVKKAVSEFLVNMCWREHFPQAGERLRVLGVGEKLRQAEEAFPRET